MAYKIKFSTSGTRRQVVFPKNQVYISKEQVKELRKLTNEKGVGGVYVYLDKEKK